MLSVLGFIAWTTAAHAFQAAQSEFPGARVTRTILPIAPMLADGTEVLSPIAAVKFCLDHADQCRSGEAARIRLDAQIWDALQATNQAVNRKIAPDPAKNGFDWSLTTRSGNCNDYAIQKRRALISAGFPSTALSLMAVELPSGDGHLVLTARTDRGDFVLDNLNDDVIGWNRTGYRLLKRQSAEDPDRWVALSRNSAKATERIAIVSMRQPAEPTPSAPVLSGLFMARLDLGWVRPGRADHPMQVPDAVLSLGTLTELLDNI